MYFEFMVIEDLKFFSFLVNNFLYFRGFILSWFIYYVFLYIYLVVMS